MKSTHLLAAASALALAACGTAEDTAPDAAATDAMAEASPEPAAADAALPSDAQGFTTAAASSDMYEITAGKLAQDKGKSQAVKDFGAMMVKDHTKSSADLKAAAAQVDGVTVPAALMPKHQANLDALKAAGDNFDTLYKQQQRAAHQEALALLRSFAAAGDAEPLKAFASKTAPVVEGHLGHVDMLP